MDADPSSDNVTRPRWTRSSNGSSSPTHRRCWNRASSRSGRAASTSRSCPRERRAQRPPSKAADAPAAIIGLLSFRGPEIAALRRTGLLVRAGIGYDIIDVGAATDAGIWVANVPDYCVDEVADHALLLLLSALRRLTELERVWHAGAWVNASLVPPVHRIRGRRLGIVGFGRIGRAVAQRAHGFGFEVVAHDPLVADDVLRAAGVEPVGLDELFATSDAITLHCPLSPETRYLVGADRLARVKPGLVLVNTSRGGLVDLAALEAALDDGRIAAVGLDVLDDEPQPDLTRALFQRPNVLLTRISPGTRSKRAGRWRCRRPRRPTATSRANAR